ncbi:MAG: phytase [Armatimonadota bacterium]|nr:phytase [Armatimonadota bacterium]
MPTVKTMSGRLLALSGLVGIFGAVCLALSPAVHHWKPLVQTAPVAGDADDPAIWIHPQNASRSLIIGTDKQGGALYVYDLQGRVVQVVQGLRRPNNVDVEYGLRIGNRRVDIAVTTEREAQQLRIYAIEQGRLREIGHPQGTRVFEGESGDNALPMGVALYRRARDGAIFAIVSRKAGPAEGYLWQYQLVSGNDGRVSLRKVRAFGRFSGDGEIEAVAVDDALGYVYYADERYGIRKYHADPDHPRAGEELAVFGTAGFEGDREGIAIYPTGAKTGYILCVDQRPENSVVHVYRREGARTDPHQHEPALAVLFTSADSTDGMEVTYRPLGKSFLRGALVLMNSKGRNFFLYPWKNP